MTPERLTKLEWCVANGGLLNQESAELIAEVRAQSEQINNILARCAEEKYEREDAQVRGDAATQRCDMLADALQALLQELVTCDHPEEDGHPCGELAVMWDCDSDEPGMHGRCWQHDETEGEEPINQTAGPAIRKARAVLKEVRST